MKRTIQNEQDKVRGSDSKMREFEAQLYNSAQEKERMIAVLKQKGFEYDELRGKYSRL